VAAVLAAAALLGAAPMTPMTAGFHQQLKCNGGYITVDVANADAHMTPEHAFAVTTAIAVGQDLKRTVAIREVDHTDAIVSIGYVVDGAFKRFPRRVLLPAVPPKPGEHMSYFNITGVVIEKHYDGTRPVSDPQGKPATGYAFSDYYKGQRLNTTVYLPGSGLTDARFYNLKAPGSDLICKAR